MSCDSILIVDVFISQLIRCAITCFIYGGFVSNSLMTCQWSFWWSPMKNIYEWFNIIWVPIFVVFDRGSIYSFQYTHKSNYLYMHEEGKIWTTDYAIFF